MNHSWTHEEHGKELTSLLASGALETGIAEIAARLRAFRSGATREEWARLFVELAASAADCVEGWVTREPDAELVRRVAASRGTWPVNCGPRKGDWQLPPKVAPFLALELPVKNRGRGVRNDAWTQMVRFIDGRRYSLGLPDVLAGEIKELVDFSVTELRPMRSWLGLTWFQEVDPVVVKRAQKIGTDEAQKAIASARRNLKRVRDHVRSVRNQEQNPKTEIWIAKAQHRLAETRSRAKEPIKTESFYWRAFREILKGKLLRNRKR